MKKFIGNYGLGEFPMSLYATEGFSGAVFCAPLDGSKTPTEIHVGLADINFAGVMDVLFHEVIEQECCHLGNRLQRTNDFSRDHSGYIFHLNHSEFANVVTRTVAFAEQCRPDLLRTWREYHKPKPVRKKKRK